MLIKPKEERKKQIIEKLTKYNYSLYKAPLIFDSNYFIDNKLYSFQRIRSGLAVSHTLHKVLNYV